MSDIPLTRRLAAIMAADVAGYSRALAADENTTLAALKRLWEAVFNPSVAAHRGRIVKMMGDGALVEFQSAVDAVGCAIAVQKAIAAGPGVLRLRIGINLGETVIDGGDIFWRRRQRRCAPREPGAGRRAAGVRPCLRPSEGQDAG